MPHSTAGYFATIAVALLLGGCRDVTAPDNGEIGVTSSAEGLVIVNSAGYPIHAVEMESGVLALIDMMPCNRGCTVQLAGERRVVPWASILGYGSGRSDYIVYWFEVETNADGSQRSGSVHITKLNP